MFTIRDFLITPCFFSFLLISSVKNLTSRLKELNWKNDIANIINIILSVTGIVNPDRQWWTLSEDWCVVFHLLCLTFNQKYLQPPFSQSLVSDTINNSYHALLCKFYFLCSGVPLHMLLPFFPKPEEIKKGSLINTNTRSS